MKYKSVKTNSLAVWNGEAKSRAFQILQVVDFKLLRHWFYNPLCDFEAFFNQKTIQLTLLIIFCLYLKVVARRLIFRKLEEFGYHPEQRMFKVSQDGDDVFQPFSVVSVGILYYCNKYKYIFGNVVYLSVFFYLICSSISCWLKKWLCLLLRASLKLSQNW